MNATMNNDTPILPTNIQKLTQEIVDAAVEFRSEVDVNMNVLDMLPTKNLQEMNDACLADIQGEAATQAQAAAAAASATHESSCDADRPTKRLKASEDEEPCSERGGDHPTSSESTSTKDDQYDEGVNVHTDPFQITGPAHQHPTSSASFAALLYNLGLANLQRNQDDTALRLFHLARDVCKKDPNSSSSCDQGSQGQGQQGVVMDEISILHNIGCLYYRRHEYEKALETFTRVEVLSLENHGSHHLSVASALNCIGVVLFHTTTTTTTANNGNGNDSKSNSNSKDVLDNLFHALSIRKGILGSEHRDVATTLNNIGRVYFDTAEYPKALSYYREALRIRRAALGPDHADVSATAFNAGQTCHKLGMLDESLELYSEYYGIASSRNKNKHTSSCNNNASNGGPGHHHQGTISVLKYIGQIYHEKSMIKEACEYYNDALKSSRQVMGHFNREAASILNLLGNLHYENGDFDEAIEVYEEGLSIERAVLHRHCNNIVVTLSNIGQALMQKGEYQTALSKYNEVHFIQCLQSEQQPDSKKISETLSIIGQVNTLLGNYPQAEKAFLKVISMTKETSIGNGEGECSTDVALALNYLGLVYFKQGALNSAMEKFQESLRVRLHAPKTSGDVAVLLYNIASIYLHKGDNESALEHYMRALEVERKALGHVHPDVAITLKLIGKVYDRCGQFEEAIRHYSEALDIYVKCSSSNSDASSSSSSDDVSTSALEISNNGGCISSHGSSRDARDHKKSAARILALIASVHLRQANTEEMTVALSHAYRLYQEIGAPVRELELESGFDLYELSILHPECAAAA